MPRPDVPVILLPGLLGSRLVKAGRSVWGRVTDFYWPLDRGRELGLAPDASGWGEVQADGLIEDIPVLPPLFKIRVYSDLIDHLVRRCGYVVGRTLFPYGYDFRKDTFTLVCELARKVDEVAQATGATEVTLLGHSHGGVLASYLARFGTADRIGVPALQASPPAPGAPPRVRIRGVVAVATAFRGALDNLRMMVNGYRPAPLGFDFDAPFHVLARSPAETLPAPGTVCFAHDDGNPAEVDIYDAATWERHELGIFAPQVRRNYNHKQLEGLAGLLANGLARGVRLHAAFAEPLPPGVAPHRVIGCVKFMTLVRGMLVTDGMRRCAFPGVERDSALVARAHLYGLFAKGDGEVDADSLAGWCGPGAGSVREVEGLHRTLINRLDTWTAVAEELAGLEAGVA